MEPITHLMTGACLARAGFNRKAAYATLAMTLAAEAPDLDTLWSIRGPVAGFQHHRGQRCLDDSPLACSSRRKGCTRN
jgi:inner membrane protein